MSDQVSVIVPARGASPHLEAALASALVADDVLELLLVHDRRAGEPALGARIDAGPRLRLLESRDPGPAAARNVGLAAARASRVAFLDDDDLWLAGHLDAAAEMFERHPQAALVAGDAFLFADRDAERGRPPGETAGMPRFLPGRAAGPLGLSEMYRANPILTPTVVLDLGRLGEAARFDSGLRVMEDYDLWLRLARRHTLVFDPRPTVVVRRRPHSASRDRRGMATASLEVLRRFEAAGLPPEITPAERRRRLGRLWHDLAYACLVEDDLPAARRALRPAIAHVPGLAKNYLYWLTTLFPAWLRRAAYARGRESG
jgi:glycosyltransferase involved in cell wall biosynthesis